MNYSDATIINAPTSTKNKNNTRDPEMHSTLKRKQAYFGMKAYIGVDKKNAIVHSAKFTPANVHDSQMTEELLHGKEYEIIGDSGYAEEKKRDRLLFREGINLITCKRAYRNKPLTDGDKLTNKLISAVRSRVERNFGVLKGLWKYSKTRYKGIEKNAKDLLFTFGLINIYRMRDKMVKSSFF